MFSFSLPKITGLYPVGAITFVTPVRPSLSIGSVKRLFHQTEPGLQLEEVAYTVYYPTTTSSGDENVPFHWVVRPIRESLRGFISFTGLPGWVLWPIIYIFGAFITIPVKANAPLLSPRQAHEQWPLIIFSHGLGGSRTAYSQLCSRVAASGKVVLAIEHRDGTAHASLPRTWGVSGKSGRNPVLYLKESDVVHDQNDLGTYPLPLRTDQLTFRRHEIYTTYNSFSRLMRGDPTLELDTIDDSPFDRTTWFTLNHHSGEPPVKLIDVNLAGHSFGGCTVLSVLSSQPSHGPPIPVAKALILDPWLEPIPSPGLAPLSPMASSRENNTNDTPANLPENQRIPRMLVINSETFTLWKDHFARLRDVVSSWEPGAGRILTLVGSQHHSFSDAQVLPLIRRKPSEMLLEVISKLSVAFLDDRLDSLLEESHTIPMHVEIIGKRKDGRPKRKLVGNVGDIVIS